MTSERALLTGALALPGLIAGYLAFAGGGFVPASLAAVVAAVLAVVAVLALDRLELTPRRIRWMAHGVLAAIVLAGLAALASRLLGVPAGTPALGADRLAYPLGDAGALGLLAGVGCILALHAAASTRERAWVRAAGAGAVPVLASVVLLTLSRGAAWSTLLGLAVYVAAARPRGLPGAALAIGPATGVALLGLDHGDVVGRTAAQIEQHALGVQPAWLVGCAALAAAGLRLGCGGLDRRLAAATLSAPGRRRLVLVSALAALTCVAVAAVVAQRLQVLPRLDGAFRLPERGAESQSLYASAVGELGLPGLLLLVAAIAALLAGLGLRARGPDRAVPAALFAAAVAWTVHAGVDSDWRTTAVCAWLVAAVGLARPSPAPGGSGAAAARGPRPAAGEQHGGDERDHDDHEHDPGGAGGGRGPDRWRGRGRGGGG